ncbi:MULTISPECIES: ATP-binding protein [unclassified Undibacterium]|uniref:ATP-binding protein n=1 Tax=unclassified Undibacterium TaxID=2630295 RepID=UPI002AC9273A|nr:MULTISPECIES: ATP-binding protein [unclassified Undibacterium]MEB0140353.1 ATP-binding protein [Undibacterium sp. CCC2.1]MEB0173402.1 ATP-binding protein [Undibacterium sp. CCC1.1]MEB0176799.1 ATP-binding protein [Undibacterium sp. CCC3.4]MEB0216544.1 ATP-binding protein [Undibacterium sp. 5I2]WPX43381.1 ATP-binding protein [Undibacterium sp. CCC3.4]
MTDYLSLLNTLDENERLEAKRGTEIGPSILETVCAFANEPGLQGGILLLGVVRDESDLFSPYVVEGILHPDALSASLATQCRDQFNVPVRVQIASEQISGCTVLVVTVPEAQPGDKPIFIKSRGLPRGAFRRIGSTDQHCTEDDLQVLYQGRQIESFDYTILPDTSMADMSLEAIEEYRKVRAEANADAEELRWNDEELLESLGCIRRHEGVWKFTVAGLQLFGRQQALRRVYPMTRVDYIRVPGKEWIPDPERRFDSVEIRDYLFRAIRRALAAVLDDLPVGFGLAEGDAQRKDKPIIPQRVLREGIVNALMHRSYRSHAPLQIIRYSNRIEIHNPGHSLKSPEHLGEPGSVPRNPRIAAVLLDTRFAETKGSGIRVMREMMVAAGLEPPLFESTRSNDSFVARYYFQHFLNEESIEWLSRFRDLHLSDEEARALVAVREQGAIDNSMYRELNRVDTLSASQSLKRLRDAGLLEQKGRGSGTYYQPTSCLLDGKREDDTISSQTDGLSSNLGSLSSNLGGLSSNLGTLSSNPNWQELPKELQEMVSSMGQRTPPDKVREALIQLCKYRSWQASELAGLFNRNADYLGTQYLRPLVSAGVLAYTIPDQPNHPHQAYRAVSDAEESE